MRFKIDWASLIFGSKLPFLLCFTLNLRAIFQVQDPGGLYLKGRFNGGFLALPVYWAYILEGLTHGGAYFQNFTVFSFIRYTSDMQILSILE